MYKYTTYINHIYQGLSEYEADATGFHIIRSCSGRKYIIFNIQ